MNQAVLDGDNIVAPGSEISRKRFRRLTSEDKLRVIAIAPALFCVKEIDVRELRHPSQAMNRLAQQVLLRFTLLLRRHVLPVASAAPEAGLLICEVVGAGGYDAVGRALQNLKRDAAQVGFFLLNRPCQNGFAGQGVGHKGYLALPVASGSDRPHPVSVQGKPFDLNRMIGRPAGAGV